MTYQANEDSQSDGEIVELYKIQTAQGSTTTTSANSPIIFNLETYLPEAIERSPIDLESVEEDPRSLTLTVPRTNPVAIRYIQSLPPDKDIVTVIRGHLDTATPDATGAMTLIAGQSTQYFEGYISSVKFTNSQAEMTVVASNSIFNRTFPKKNFRHLCNHILYDTGCAVAEGAFEVPVTVTAINGNVLTLSGVPAIGAATPTAKLVDAVYYDGGILTQPSGGDTRMILALSRGASDTVELLFPFQEIGLGSVLTMIPGCDHTLPTCLANFDNAQRYGGFPYVPTDNVFQKKLAD